MVREQGSIIISRVALDEAGNARAYFSDPLGYNMDIMYQRRYMAHIYKDTGFYKQ
jgi:hypothetical protein